MAEKEKKKKGRKPVKDKAIYRLKMYFNDEHWKIIEDRAKAKKVKTSKYIKWCIEKDLFSVGIELK